MLDNGMVVYLPEDHELPLVTINDAQNRQLAGPGGQGWPRGDDRRSDAHRRIGLDVTGRGR